jgi:hypothetical protein
MKILFHILQNVLNVIELNLNKKTIISNGFLIF